MSSSTAPPPVRKRHVRPSSRREHLPARANTSRSHGLPSPRRVLAAQVVAWHNAHPLARRIGRRQLGGYGVISLPFSPAAAESSAGPSTGELAAEAPTRFPMFDDLSMVKGIPRHKIVALALTDGWDERPGAPEWPLREVKVARGWRESQTQRIHLLTVAIKRGGNRPPLRVLIGRHGLSAGGTGIVGQRMLSRPRMALIGLSLAVPMLFVGWGLTTMLRAMRGPEPTPPLVADAARNLAAPSPAPAVMPSRAAPAPLPSTPAAPAPTAARPSPDDILPVPSVTAPAHGPRVGSGMPMRGQENRAAAPTQFRLVGAPFHDPEAMRNQAMQLQAALQAMGHTGGRVRMDVIGTPEGDALSVGPLSDQGEAEKLARRLAAHGLVLRVTEQ